MTKLYDQAITALEKADMRQARVKTVKRPDHIFNKDIKPGYRSLAYWTKDRVNEWLHDDIIARQVADTAVTKAASIVEKMQKMVDKSENNREYAKAVSARIETVYAIWLKAYTRAMPSKWK